VLDFESPIQGLLISAEEDGPLAGCYANKGSLLDRAVAMSKIAQRRTASYSIVVAANARSTSRKPVQAPRQRVSIYLQNDSRQDKPSISREGALQSGAITGAVTSHEERGITTKYRT
jgi:hypothetical protein